MFPIAGGFCKKAKARTCRGHEQNLLRGGPDVPARCGGENSGTFERCVLAPPFCTPVRPGRTARTSRCAQIFKKVERLRLGYLDRLSETLVKVTDVKRLEQNRATCQVVMIAFVYCE